MQEIKLMFFILFSISILIVYANIGLPMQNVLEILICNQIK